MDRIVLGSVLFAVPVIVLLYLSYRMVVAALRLFHSGRIVESLGLLGTTIVAARLVGKFGNEKHHTCGRPAFMDILGGCIYSLCAASW